MSFDRETNINRKKKKKAGIVAEFVSWKEKKTLADKEEEVLDREVEELITWTGLIEAMDDQQLKEYVTNRPENTKIVKNTPIKRVQRSTKSKCSTSNGLMESIWKFHKEDDEEAPLHV